MWAFLMFVAGIGAGIAFMLVVMDVTDPAKQLQRAEAQLAQIQAREQHEAEQRGKEKAFLEQRVAELRQKVAKP